MTGYLDPLNKLFPVPLDGGIPSFWQLAAEWKHRPARRCGDSPSLWDEQTRVAARWANGPRPAGGEAMWTTYVEPVKPLPSHTWPQPAVAGPPPTFTVRVPPPAKVLALPAAAAEVTDDHPLPPLPPGQWDDEDTDARLKRLSVIWQESEQPPARPFLAKAKGRRRRGTDQ